MPGPLPPPAYFRAVEPSLRSTLLDVRSKGERVVWSRGAKGTFPLFFIRPWDGFSLALSRERVSKRDELRGEQPHSDRVPTRIRMVLLGKWDV